MWPVSAIVYWSSLGLIGYAYLGYPVLIRALAAVRARPSRTGDLEPTVSVVMAVRNEALHIEPKLQNLLSLDYPAEKLEIIVVDDGSTDDTERVIGAFRDRGVMSVKVNEAKGKPSALNRGVERATGDIVVFCDARQRVDEKAVRWLVRHFADPEVGIVSAELQMEGSEGPGMYWRYEKAIRAAEARFDSVVGATGALYAMRRHLFRPLPSDCLLDDVFTPMQIAMRGYRVLVEPSAKVFDTEANPAREFARKARTLAGNYQILEQLPGLLNPRQNRLWFQYTSHKVVRLVVPFAMVSLFVSNLALLARFTGSARFMVGRPLHVTTLLLQLSGYAGAVNRAVSKERAGPLSRICHTLVVLNAAAVEGLRRYVKRDFSWGAAPRTASARSRGRRDHEGPTKPSPKASPVVQTP